LCKLLDCGIISFLSQPEPVEGVTAAIIKKTLPACSRQALRSE